MTNLLINGGFENTDGHDQRNVALVITPDPAAGHAFYWNDKRGEIKNPAGWRSWYVHDTRPMPHDPGNCKRE